MNKHQPLTQPATSENNSLPNDHMSHTDVPSLGLGSRDPGPSKRLVFFWLVLPGQGAPFVQCSANPPDEDKVYANQGRSAVGAEREVASRGGRTRLAEGERSPGQAHRERLVPFR